MFKFQLVACMFDTLTTVTLERELLGGGLDPSFKELPPDFK